MHFYIRAVYHKILFISITIFKQGQKLNTGTMRTKFFVLCPYLSTTNLVGEAAQLANAVYLLNYKSVSCKQSSTTSWYSLCLRLCRSLFPLPPALNIILSVQYIPLPCRERSTTEPSGEGSPDAQTSAFIFF